MNASSTSSPPDPPAPLNWIAVDWGTSNLRAWALDRGDQVLDERRADTGMGTLASHEFEPALLALVDDWLPGAAATDVLCCGMVGARQGWHDAGYASTPHDGTGPPRHVDVPARDERLRVKILAGVRQASPADVMRGEETQIAGFLRDRPGFDGTLCLPGTHTKWARIANGRLERFATCLTGELFALLSERSVLRHSLQDEGWDEARFVEAVHRTARHPESLLRSLFALRAEGLLEEIDSGVTRAGLSGSLLGAELAAVRDAWEGTGEGDIVVIGDSTLAALHVRALAALGRRASARDGSDLALAGLIAAHRKIESSTPLTDQENAP